MLYLENVMYAASLICWFLLDWESFPIIVWLCILSIYPIFALTLTFSHSLWKIPWKSNLVVFGYILKQISHLYKLPQIYIKISTSKFNWSALKIDMYCYFKIPASSFFSHWSDYSLPAIYSLPTIPFLPCQIYTASLFYYHCFQLLSLYNHNL